MKKRFALITLFAGAALLVTVAVVGRIPNVRKSGGSFFALIGLQSATSSQGAASSTSNGISAVVAPATLEGALRQFQDQIQSLDNQILDLRSEIEIAKLRSSFTRTLRRGDVGDDVSKLQELLTKFPDFYSSDVDLLSTVTGRFGSSTGATVMQFQSQVGLSETGVFDFATREKFYESVNALMQDSVATEFAPVDVSSIAGLNNSSKQSITDLQNQVVQLTSDLTIAQGGVTDLQNQVTQLTSDLAGAQTAIVVVQGQMATLRATPPPPPPPPPPALVISNIQVTSIAQQSATVTWTTNVSSTSEVDYSTDAALLASKTLILTSASAVTSHSIKIQSLTSGIKYYYRVLSKDSTNATGTSPIQNFTTTH